MATPTAVFGYLALFLAVGFIFLFVNLLVGYFLRPKNPNKEKLEIYECGEPPIGSSFVQFDLRFYVVALLFIIFDVEVAFFFPWATVFGKANQLSDPHLHQAAVVSAEKITGLPIEEVAPRYQPIDGITQGSAAHVEAVAELRYAEQVEAIAGEMGVPAAEVPGSLGNILEDPSQGAEQVQRMAHERLAWFSFYDILAFFTVLMVGFFYVWKRGDLDWVRAISKQRSEPIQRTSDEVIREEEPVTVA